MALLNVTFESVTFGENLVNTQLCFWFPPKIELQ